MTFLAKTSRGIGTSATAVGAGATPASGKTWIVIGLTLCNVSGSPVSVTAVLHDASGNETSFLYNFPLPVGETVVPEGALGKIVLAPTETIKITSSAASSVDVIMSVLETP